MERTKHWQLTMLLLLLLL
uniref:Uncharacterized protein n=1 Tax=Arundo donax TaxID=35708 RepID=A0A0A8ZGU5_ARUDO